MAAVYTTLNADQKEAIMTARNDQTKEIVGMAKFEVYFMDGKHCTMLSDQCKSVDDALDAAIERFGSKVKCVK